MNAEELFLKAVKAEIKALKLLATPEERNRLDIKTFSPANPMMCIYGQMTGNCTSIRAIELIQLCCTKAVVKESLDTDDDLTMHVSNEIILCDNNSNLWGRFDSRLNYYPRQYFHVSALEAYIMLKNSKIEIILSYLKDTTKTLKL